jgi:predicted alpha-1,2-mannosidase
VSAPAPRSPASVRALARGGVVSIAGALLGALLVTSSVSFGSQATAGTPPAPALTEPAALVHPLDGTGTGPVSPGTVGEFPGADVPFGMLQWSPDTSPDGVQSGGGYAYADSGLNGFSLTHLSGTGCPSYQDIPILPTVGPLGGSPVATLDTLSHAQEQASPGRYSVELGPAPIGVTLADTTRTGIAGFDFPAGTESNVLFKVANSANPATAASVRIVGDDAIEGQVTSGGFCGTGTDYTLHFAARFNRPFAVAGTWTASGKTGETSCTGTSCGAYVTFDTTTQQHVLLKVGISFVSIANAAQNLAAEDPGWSLARVSAQAQADWNILLGKIAVRGGTAAQQHTFYTALYHSLLFPNVVSDSNGEYAGFDGRVHTARSGHEEYANFSEWDIYRSEVQLESLLVPVRVSDMVQSLVDDARQNGWLPRWAIVAGDTSQINGDSADPIIADAYAMGARDFDTKAALAAMVKGATQNETGHGLEIERQYLDQYLSQHYVNAGSLDLTSIDYSIGGSVTLEYAIDDFAIAQLAAAQHDTSLAADMMRRAASWEYLFNPATGYVQARGEDGSFPAGPAFDPSQFEPGGQTGFEEGNAVQYTWSVPQNLAALASLLGGDAAAEAKLKTFFTALNAARYSPYDWSGNEPDEWAPWEFDYFGAPEQTQGTVRAIVDTEYADAPVDEPGNDDLGAISSWYVWGSLGMFPVTPATANLALASPLFPSVTISLPDGRRLVEDAPGAASSRPYVHALTVSGVTKPPSSGGATCATRIPPSAHTAGTWDLPWLPASVLQSGGTLTYSLSGIPDPTWGSAPADSPPSFGNGASPAVGFSSPSGTVSVTVGRPTAIQIGVAPAAPGVSTVHWQVTSDPTGMSVTPSSGTFTITSTSQSSSTVPPARCPAPHAQTQALIVVASAPGSYALRVTLATDRGLALPPVVLDVTAQP